MEQLLLSKGFILNKYNSGNYYEYIREDIDDSVREIGKLFGFNQDYISEEFILQCDESFGICIVYVDGNSFRIDEDEFFYAVRSMSDKE